MPLINHFPLTETTVNVTSSPGVVTTMRAAYLDFSTTVNSRFCLISDQDKRASALPSHAPAANTLSTSRSSCRLPIASRAPPVQRLFAPDTSSAHILFRYSSTILSGFGLHPDRHRVSTERIMRIPGFLIDLPLMFNALSLGFACILHLIPVSINNE